MKEKQRSSILSKMGFRKNDHQRSGSGDVLVDPLQHPLSKGALFFIGFVILLSTLFFSHWQSTQSKRLVENFASLNELENAGNDLDVATREMDLALRMSAYSGEASWENRYYQLQEQLDISSKKLGISEDTENHRELKKIAEGILLASRKGKLSQAKEIVNSLEYEQILTGLFANSKNAMARTHQQAQRYQKLTHDANRRIYAATIVCLVLEILMIMLGFEIIRRWTQLADSVNTSLNQKVLEKTREIQEQSEQMLIASKMATLGEMSSGIAHEINNPLSIILAKSHLLQESLKSESPDRQRVSDYFSKILEMAQRIDKIVRGLKVYSRTAEFDVAEPMPLKDMLMEALALCEEKIQLAKVQVHIQDLPDLDIICHETHLVQILVNLVSNSCDAVVGEAQKEPPWIRFAFQESEHEFKIFVIDSGHGIPGEVLQKMNRPFFTTKPKGKGTGIGLTLCKKIMEHYGGRLSLVPKHANTCFEIVFPNSNILKNESSPVV